MKLLEMTFSSLLYPSRRDRSETSGGEIPFSCLLYSFNETRMKYLQETIFFSFLDSVLKGSIGIPHNEGNRGHFQLTYLLIFISHFHLSFYTNYTPSPYPSLPPRPSSPTHFPQDTHLLLQTQSHLPRGIELRRGRSPSDFRQETDVQIRGVLHQAAVGGQDRPQLGVYPSCPVGQGWG